VAATAGVPDEMSRAEGAKLAGRRRRRLAWRRSAAFAGSALFHLGLFVFAFARASGSLVSAARAGGGAPEPVYQVSLVRSPAQMAAEAAAAQVEPIHFKLRKVTTDDSLPASTQAPSSQLDVLLGRLQAFGEAAPPQSSISTAAPSTKAFIPRRVADSRLVDGRVGTEAATGAPTSTGTLWGAIEPCWHNLGISTQTPVVIEISLDALGRVRKPPRVVRSETAMLDDPRLKSEANVLAALAACLPRGDLRFATKNYRLIFPPT
jgi:hypothetical protein